MLTGQNAQANAADGARRKPAANSHPAGIQPRGAEAQTGEERKSAGDGGSARLQCRRGDDFTILGTDYREGRQSRARQLWLETRENK